jgi:acyl carrier protein
MYSPSTIREAVFRTIAHVNELLPPEQALDAQDDLVLVGPNAALDSMGFVNFVVALEEELENRLGKPLNISDLLLIQTDDGAAVSTVSDLVTVLSHRLE